MKRLVLTILCSCLVALLPASGQNNPYEILDECYQHFRQAESLLGREGFADANARLLHSAISLGDTKAQTLYYVEELKNATRIAYNTKNFDAANDARVLKAFEETKAVADKLGYPQYFYYAYELLENYYYNSKRQLKTLELVQEMQNLSLKRNEPYGE